MMMEHGVKENKKFITPTFSSFPITMQHYRNYWQLFRTLAINFCILGTWSTTIPIIIWQVLVLVDDGKCQWLS